MPKRAAFVLAASLIALTGCATPQADQGAARVDGGLKLDRG